MFCPNCGTQNPDDVKFCANCGAALSVDVNAASSPAPAAAYAAQSVPVSEYASQPASYPAPAVTCVPPAPALAPVVEIPAPKQNVLCTVAFFGSLASISLLGTTALPFLIVSIIGFISAIKNKENGIGYAIAGMIITGILVLTWITGIILGLVQSGS